MASCPLILRIVWVATLWWSAFLRDHMILYWPKVPIQSWTALNSLGSSSARHLPIRTCTAHCPKDPWRKINNLNLECSFFLSFIGASRNNTRYDSYVLWYLSLKKGVGFAPKRASSFPAALTRLGWWALRDSQQLRCGVIASEHFAVVLLLQSLLILIIPALSSFAVLVAFTKKKAGRQHGWSGGGSAALSMVRGFAGHREPRLSCRFSGIVDGYLSLGRQKRWHCRLSEEGSVTHLLES